MRRETRLLVYLLFLLSGGTALVYQVTWVRNLSLVFGASFQAVSIVLASFMAGLALGGFSFGRGSSSMARPLRVYGMLEMGIALFALALPSLLGAVDDLYVSAALAAGGVTPGLNAMRVMMAFGVLVLPTFLMGATLPVLIRFIVHTYGELETRLAFLYGINTLGAALGALTAGFVLVPSLGLWHTQVAAAAVNLAIGIVALVAGTRAAPLPPETEAGDPAGGDDLPPLAPHEVWPVRLTFWGTGISGMCALAFEVLWTRTLTLSVGTTTYSFTVMLAAFLIGIWLGSWIHAMVPLRRVSESLQFGVVLWIIGLSSALVSLVMPLAPQIMLLINYKVFGSVQRIEPATALVLGFFVMLVPCIFMGIAFPLAAQARARLVHRFGASTGDTLGLNTVGSIIGSLAAGFVLIPYVGLQNGVLGVASLELAYGSIVLAAVAASRMPERRLVFGAAAAALVVLSFGAPRWLPRWDAQRLGAFTNNQIGRFLTADGGIDLEAGLKRDQVLYFKEGRAETIAVVDHVGYHRSIMVNGKTVASDWISDLQVEYLLGHVPAMLHPNPKSGLVVGLGAGVTLGSLAAHESIEELVLVEIEPAVLGGAALFSAVNDDVLEDPRLQVVIQDGRNFLKTTDRKFDVITTDPVHPWAAGAASLYTVEYYTMALSHLTERGVFCQWLPAYELTDENFRAAIGSFAAAFPYVNVWQSMSDAVLIGSPAPLEIDAANLARRLQEPLVNLQLSRIGMESPKNFLAEFALDDAGTRTYVENALMNTDDNLYLEYESPKAIGIPQKDNIFEINRVRQNPVEVLTGYAPVFDSEQAAFDELKEIQWAKAQTVLAFYDIQEPGEPELPMDARLRGVIARVPDYRPARVLLGTALGEASQRQLEKNNLAGAMKLARMALEVDPDVASAHYTLGVGMVRLGRGEEGFVHLEAAMALRPRLAQLNEELIETLVRRERQEDAIRVLRIALAATPDDPALSARLNELLAGDPQASLAN